MARPKILSSYAVDDWSNVFLPCQNLDNAVFSSLKTGTLSSSSFQLISSGTSSKGVDSNDFILYDKSDGDLYFDRDGSKGRYHRVLFAHVVDGTAMSNIDFHIS